MKLWKKLIFRISMVILLIGIGSFHFSRSMMCLTYGNLTLPKGMKIEKVAVVKNGQILRIDQVGSDGNTLGIQIKDERINIPWTLYLPFYQFGTISSSLVFDAQIQGKYWRSLSLSVSGSVTRYAVVPELFRKEEIRQSLLDGLFKTVEVRISESQK